MAENSKIEWTTHTFNPWLGCTKVSPGCVNCYAEAEMDHRWGKAKWGPNGTRVVTSVNYWRQPLKWNREAAAAEAAHRRACEQAHGEYDAPAPYQRPRVFCASEADVFEAWDGRVMDHKGQYPVLDHRHRLHLRGDNTTEAITLDILRMDLFALIYNTPHLDWLLLTKRPDRMRDFLTSHNRPGFIQGQAAIAAVPGRDRSEERAEWFMAHPMTWPLPNVWVGTSVEDQQRADERIPQLLQVPGVVRFLSVEPLLGPISFADGPLHPEESTMGEWSVLNLGIGWVIVGGESGQKARPMHIKWAGSIVKECQAAGVPVFVKQLGANVEACDIIDAADYFPGDVRLSEAERSNARVHLKMAKGGNPEEWPADLRVRQFPEVRR